MSNETTPLTEAQLQEDEDLVNELLGGEWRWYKNDQTGRVTIFKDTLFHVLFETWSTINARFVIRARTALPQYIAEVRRLRGILGELGVDYE